MAQTVGRLHGARNNEATGVDDATNSLCGTYGRAGSSDHEFERGSKQYAWEERSRFRRYVNPSHVGKDAKRPLFTAAAELLVESILSLSASRGGPRDQVRVVMSKIWRRAE